MIPVCQVLDAALHGKQAPQLSEEDWKTVYRQLSEHAVYALPNELLKGHIDDYQLQQDYYSHYVRFEQILTVQQEVIDTLTADNIPCVIMKGLAAAALYPEPALRSQGDIDVLVPAECFNKAEACLIDADFQLKVQFEGDERARYKKHAKFCRHQIDIELHIRPFRLTDKKNQKALYLYIDKGLKNPDMIVLQNYQFPSFPPLQSALEYLCHLRNHVMAKGAGLRQLLDWMLFAEQYLDDSFYLEKMHPILEKANLDTFAKTVTYICQKYLGMTEEIHWCKDVKSMRAGDLLMEEILQSGNLGRISPVGSSDARVFQRSFTESLILLYEGGLFNFPGLKKHWWTRILSPFAQLGFMVKYLFTNHSNVINSWKIGRRRKALFKELGLK